MAEFAGVAPKVSELLMQIRDWKVWVLYDRDPEPGWSEGRATLLGDAAHPMLPYLAQGACMAIEDAVVLGDQFAQAPTIPEAFAAYERLRYPRTSAVQPAARRAGVINHVAGAERDARNEALARQKSDDYEAVAWLFEGADSPAGQPGGGTAFSARCEEPTAPDRTGVRIATCGEAASAADFPEPPESRRGDDNGHEGIVTLPRGERKASAAQELSGGCERGPPRVHRRGAKHAARLG